MVLIHRWSLYGGLVTCKIFPWGPAKCGLYKQVVFIYRWTLEKVRLYIHFQICNCFEIIFNDNFSPYDEKYLSIPSFLNNETKVPMVKCI